VSKIFLSTSPDSKLPNLESALSKQGHSVLASLDLESLAALGGTSPPERISVVLGIVDVSCGRDGTAYCQAFHDAYPLRPLILLVDEDAQVSEACKKITCGNVLEMPFTHRKVLNQVTRLLSRQQGIILKAGRLTLNLQTRCVSYGEVIRRLTPKQAELLHVFMEHEGETLTRKFLMATVWNTDYMGDTRTLDVHVRWLRERIEDEPSNPQYLRTVRGIGYRFGIPSEE
jgi:DNA-binding response OmpR family regulator